MKGTKMKTHLTPINEKIWPALTLCGVMLILVGMPRIVEAQSNTFPSSGNAGIGTTTPNAKLHIISSDDTVAPAISIRQDSAAGYGFDFLLDTNVNGNLYINRVNNGTSVNVMTLDRAGGNIGIGTTNPGRPLVVAADANGIPLRVYRNVNTVGFGTGIDWAFNNSAGNVTDYAYVNSAIINNTAGAENGTLGFFTIKSGTLTQQAII